MALLASWITLRVIPWLKARTNRQQQEYLLSTIRILVYAAEQIYGAGRGSNKYQYVENELDKRGLNVDAAAIEAAVREMNLLKSWETSLTTDLNDHREDHDAETE
ncbi:MAG: holin [Clostridiales bacterium]|nr:holin [Clostridiales bacterium]MBQ8963016.1 holin [Clostridia bacterium]